MSESFEGIRSRFRFGFLLIAVGSVGWVGPAVAQDSTPQPLSTDDMFQLKRVGAPVASPDGAWIAYTVSTTSLEDESTSTRLWMVSSEGGDPVPMTGEGLSAGNPSWRPGGDMLTFQGSRNGSKSQVWGLSLRGGEAHQLTKAKNGISGYWWSPDGSRLLLAIRDPEEEELQGGDEDADADDDADDDDALEPWVIDRLQIKRDNVGYLDRRRTHLYVQDMTTEEVEQLTSGDYDDSSPAWSPDGRRVAFVSNRTAEPDANSNTDIWIVEANGDNDELVRLTQNPGSDGQPSWSPDGELIAYTTGIEPDIIWYATTHLAVVASSGGDPSVLTQSLDRNVSRPTFGPDGDWIYFGLEDSAERHIARIQPDGGNLERPLEGPVSVRGFDVIDEGRIAALVSTPAMPSEIHIQQRGELKRLTHANDGWLAQRQLADVRNATFESADGTEVEGLFYLPPGYSDGTRYPTLLRIHGGPVSQYDHSFNMEAQIFAGQGYVVVTTNPRGSSGYGQEFSHAIWADWGNKDFQDVMAGVDYAIEQGWADPDRLGVGGWSYGGILTNYVVTKTDRFEGAITGASEVLYRSNYGHDHYQRQWEAELGLPWVTPEAWERISPFNDVDNIVTPTLIMGGEKDWNVPILNSEQLYQALKRLGRTTQLVVYPGEHHGIRRPSFQKDRMERYLAWYEKYVKVRPNAVS
ncbi:MAG: prolyl oligopeptidase family serine peptidase [Longimicrobiales bacterium]